MDVVICYCLKCREELGRFRNSWNAIGNSYFSPVYSILSYADGFDGSGDAHLAAPGSQIENSFLQDLACKQCKTILGLRCDSAPEGHMLMKNQLILRLQAMSVISELTGQKAKVSVLKTFSLTLGGTKKSASRRASTAQPHGRVQSQRLQAEVVMRNLNNSHMMPPSAKDALSEPPAFKFWAQDAINSQQKDIDRTNETVNRIEVGMESFKNFMQEVRTELAANRERQSIVSAEDLKIFRDDVDQLRLQINAATVRENDTTQRITRSLNSLDHLSEDVQNFSVKANELDGLREELHQLKEKVRNLDEAIQHKETHDQEFLNDSWTQNRTMVDLNTESSSPMRPLLRVEVSPLLLGQEVVYEYPATPPSPQDGASGTEQTALTPSLKRKRGAATHDEPAASNENQSPPELPTKRRRLSTKSTKRGQQSNSNASAKQFQAQQPEVPEILSSENGRSPILGRCEEPTPFHHDQETRDNNHQPEAKPVTAISALKRGAKGSRRLSEVTTTSTNEAANPVTAISTLKRGATRSRRESAVMTPSTNEAAKPVAISAEAGNRKRKSNIFSGRLRDLNGFLLTPGGKVDGRSVRKKRGMANNENENPVGSSLAVQVGYDDDTPADELHTPLEAQLPSKSAQSLDTQPSIPIVKKHTDVPANSAVQKEAIHQSIETDDPGLPSNPAISASASPALEQEPIAQIKPYSCGTCGKRYSSIQSLKDHKDRPTTCSNVSDLNELPLDFICTRCERSYKTLQSFNMHKCGRSNDQGANDLNDVDVDGEAEARRRQMLAREKLVKDTMERESGLG